MREFNFDSTWSFGANFTPSNAINQLEMWQKETFSPEVIRRELGYAKRIGMNMMRVFLHDLLWEQDANGFLVRMDEFLSIADDIGIKIMFVFFDDCWKSEFSLGKQPDPVPLSHNSGWIQSPGQTAADDPAQRPRLEEYVKGVLNHFKNDGRIAVWDLYNEPGNGSCGNHITQTGLRENASLPLLLDVFKWAKEVSPSQPYTAGIWNYSDSFGELNKVMAEYSEILTFHFYGDEEDMQKTCLMMQKMAKGRSIICTEYMARHLGSTFKHVLPILRKNNIGAINWGLVSGKTQTIYPWDDYKKDDRYTLPFHDIFEQNGAFLVPEEEFQIGEIIGLKNK